MIKKLKKKNGKVYLIALDLSKAFDVLPYEIILKNTSCHPIVKRFLASILTSSEMFIGNDKEQHNIRCRRGVRQGGILSRYLFLTIANIFLEKCITLGNNDSLGYVCGYADDFYIITSYPGWGEKILRN